ncbi:MAG: hypothetical protein V1790_17540 [Planctomycetota bacterium]
MPTTTWSSTQTPEWSPGYQSLNERLLAGIQDRLANPAAGTEPLRIAAIDATNRRFAGLPQKLATNLASRGYGKSGALGGGIKGLELARQGEIGGIESEFAKMLLGREDQNYNLAAALMGLNKGQEGSGTQKTTQSWLENIMQIAGMGMGALGSYFGGKPATSPYNQGPGVGTGEGRA